MRKQAYAKAVRQRQPNGNPSGTGDPHVSLQLERVLTFAVASQVWTLDNRPVMVTLANCFDNAEIAAPKAGLVELLKALTSASRQRYFWERSAVTPLRVVAGPGGFSLIGNPELFEAAKLLSDEDPLYVRVDVFRGPLSDRDVRNLRGHELISAPPGTPAERAAQCLRYDLLPTALRPASKRKVKPGVWKHMRIVSRIFGQTEPAVRGRLLRRHGGSRSNPKEGRSWSAEHAARRRYRRYAKERIPSAGSPAANDICTGEQAALPVMLNAAGPLPAVRTLTKRSKRSAPTDGQQQLLNLDG